MLQIAGAVYRAAPVENADITVGLAVDVGAQKEPPSEVIQREAPTDRHYIGRDGILVILGPAWSAENMSLEPQQRRGSA